MDETLFKVHKEFHGAAEALEQAYPGITRDQNLITMLQRFDAMCGHAKDSIVDPLTDLWNIRYLNRRLPAHVELSRRHGYPLSVVFLDVDDYGLFNKEHGHAVGDDVLRSVGRAIRDSVRRYDEPCRYGGDEFVVILPDSSGDRAVEVARRIRRNVYDLDIEDSIGSPLKITVTQGISDNSEDSEADLILRANKALFAAKKERGSVYISRNGIVEPVIRRDSPY